MWSGWIVIPKEDRSMLVGLGAKILSEEEVESGSLSLQIEISDTERLDPYWGRFVWGLKKVEEIQ